jgi:hypothetical protein
MTPWGTSRAFQSVRTMRSSTRSTSLVVDELGSRSGRFRRISDRSMQRAARGSLVGKTSPSSLALRTTTQAAGSAITRRLLSVFGPYPLIGEECDWHARSTGQLALDASGPGKTARPERERCADKSGGLALKRSRLRSARGARSDWESSTGTSSVQLTVSGELPFDGPAASWNGTRFSRTP